MVRQSYQTQRILDDRITYRGTNPGRMENLTDAVFGIAITLLIFNLSNPNSFADLLRFTQTLPAFVLSIAYLMLIWTEHARFCHVYGLRDASLEVLNIAFLALVIFFVYPLRFLTLFLTSFFFNTQIEMQISFSDVPYLMIYFSLMVFAVYLVLYLFHLRVGRMADQLELSAYEQVYTRANRQRMLLMLLVPLISIATILMLQSYSSMWASIAGGIIYNLYIPLMFWWKRKTERAELKVEN